VTGVPIGIDCPSSKILRSASVYIRGTHGREGAQDRMLLIGGLALVVLILTDTVFLTLSSRVVR
jgi:hypothetical protein